jgi:hypothetical protein
MIENRKLKNKNIDKKTYNLPELGYITEGLQGYLRILMHN